MTTIILGMIGLWTIVIVLITRDSAIVATMLRRLTLARSETTGRTALVIRHLRRPPSRWAGA